MATTKAIQSLSVNFRNANKFEETAGSTKPSKETTTLPGLVNVSLAF